MMEKFSETEGWSYCLAVQKIEKERDRYRQMTVLPSCAHHMRVNRRKLPGLVWGTKGTDLVWNRDQTCKNHDSWTKGVCIWPNVRDQTCNLV